eukprot:TRINITY_DN8936_c0_g1_i1.p1 TRINITY_DN8936_c0_g1~~TRINITY_DN8936_c0_g1_i1.p1  ORF type:complete len:305 (+),score=36.49 TRINITY_DN8936_c0_g1_i1:78-992(+)
MADHDDTGHKVLVENLPATVTTDQLRAIFACYGNVISVYVTGGSGPGRNTRSPKATVSYELQENAQLAIDTLNGGIPEMLQRDMSPTRGLACSHVKKEQLVPNHEKHSKYKTVLCKQWEGRGCSKGSACAFAHGEAELRKVDSREIRDSRDRDRDRGDRDRGDRGGRERDWDRGVEVKKEQPQQPQHNSRPSSVQSTPPAGAGSAVAERQIKFLRRLEHPLAKKSGHHPVEVSFLPPWVDVAGIYYLCAPYGAIVDCSFSPLTNDGYGSATVTFTNRDDALIAVKGLNTLSIDFNCPDLQVALV